MKRSDAIIKTFGVAMVFIILASMCTIMPASPASAATFNPGDEVEVYNTGGGLQVLNTYCGSWMFTMPDGARGSILDGPSPLCAGSLRWHVRWGNGSDGWSSEDYLRKVSDQPVAKFSVGQRVQVVNMGTYDYRVRNTPPGLSCQVNSRHQGDRGTIISPPDWSSAAYYGVPDISVCTPMYKGPNNDYFYRFYYIRWDGDNQTGWSAEGAIDSDYLELCILPDAPSNPSPRSGTTGISISVSLRWAYCNYATSYDVYFGSSPNPSYLGNTSTSSYPLPPLSLNTHYYWKIVAKNACGNTSGQTWDFTTEASIPVQVVNFPDPNLQAAIRQAIGKPTGDIYQSDLVRLTTLYANDAGITDLTGLEWCTSLTTLGLVGNQIKNASALSGLTNLTSLWLAGNQISDLMPLSGLTNLTQLWLSWNQRISDVSPLSGLTNLTELMLDLNQISNIAPLSNLTKLTRLQLNGNAISDLSPLSGLTNLTRLFLGSWIAYGGTIYPGGNQITDISPLSSLTNLTELSLELNQMTDLSPLSGLTKLTYLDLAWNKQISDISVLSNLTSLTTLYLNEDSITNISPLSALTNLTWLWLDDNPIGDIGPLSGLTNLTHLDLPGTKINNISALSHLTNLTSLYLDGNQISDISPLSGLTSLRYLDLSSNLISDIKPLVDNAGLAQGDTVYLYSNALSADSLYVYIPQLQARGVTVYFTQPSAPSISVTPTSGLPGSKVTITGSGWTANQNNTLSLTFSGQSWLSVSTDANGNILPSTLATIPPNSSAGANQIVGHDVNYPTVPAASTNFTVIPRGLYLTPSSGPIGTTVLVTGGNMTPNGTIPVGSLTFGSLAWNTHAIAIDSTGVIVPTSLSVPQAAQIGNNMVQATDSGGLVSSAVFTVTPTPTFGSITGIVSSASYVSSPLPGATVSVNGTSLSATSAYDGSYTISNVPAGISYTVTASAAGYDSSWQSVTVYAGQTSTLNFAMIRSPAPIPNVAFGFLQGDVPSRNQGIPSLQFEFNYQPYHAYLSGLGSSTLSLTGDIIFNNNGPVLPDWLYSIVGISTPWYLVNISDSAGSVPNVALAQFNTGLLSTVDSAPIKNVALPSGTPTTLAALYGYKITFTASPTNAVAEEADFISAIFALAGISVSTDTNAEKVILPAALALFQNTEFALNRLQGMSPADLAKIVPDAINVIDIVINTVIGQVGGMTLEAALTNLRLSAVGAAALKVGADLAIDLGAFIGAGLAGDISDTYQIEKYSITPTSLPTAKVGVAYSQNLQVSGGSGSYNWSWVAVQGSELPAGLTLDQTGCISGTPTAAGTFNFVLEATDAGGSGVQYLSIAVNPGLIITPTSMPTGEVQVGFSQHLAAWNGSGDYYWDVISGSLPPGLNLNRLGATPFIWGEPTTAGTFAFTIQARDLCPWCGSFDVTGTQSYTITINPNLTQVAVGVIESGTAYVTLNDGVSVGITGSAASDATPAFITSTSYGNNQPAGTGSILLLGSQFYDVNVSSYFNLGTNAVAQVSITNLAVTDQTIMEYWDGTTWDSASNLAIAGSTITGDIPVSFLEGTPVAIGGPNTPVGSPVTVTLPGALVTFSSVSGSGATTAVAESPPCGSLPSGYFARGSAFHITTTATYTSPVTVGISYNPATTSDPQNLRLFHCDGSGWRDVTTSVDTVNQIVYGQDSTLSWWQIGDPAPPPAPGPGGASVPVFPSVYIGIAAAFGAAAVAYLLRRRFIVRQ